MRGFARESSPNHKFIQLGIQSEEGGLCKGILITASEPAVLVPLHCGVKKNTTILHNNGLVGKIDRVLAQSVAQDWAIFSAIWDLRFWEFPSQNNKKNFISWKTLNETKITKSLWFKDKPIHLMGQQENLLYVQSSENLFCHGDSGSGIVNSKGEVVGILLSGATSELKSNTEDCKNRANILLLKSALARFLMP